MALPKISIYDNDGNEKVSTWLVGTVKAGTSSTELTVNIWNNRYGSSDSPDMIECSIVAFDKNGGSSEAIVSDEIPWVKVNVNDSPEIDSNGLPITEIVNGAKVNKKAFHPIGANKPFPLWKASADPITFPGYKSKDPNKNYYGYCDIDKRVDYHIISGKVNLPINRKENYAKCTFKVDVPKNAQTSTVGFRIRLQGYYV